MALLGLRCKMFRGLQDLRRTATTAKRTCTTTTTKKRRRKLTPEANSATMERFWYAERMLDAGVRPEMLSDVDKEIHRRHGEAVARMKLMYDDPATGLKVLTRLKHFTRNECCGSACRHCVYGYEKVSEDKRERRKFNTAFWEDMLEK
jgi:hypothetical protein